MAQRGQLITVRTDPATQLRAACAQNAALTLNLPMGSGNGYVDAGLAGGKTVKSRLQSLRIASVENLAWDVWLWRSDLFNTYASVADLATQYVAGRYPFAEANGVQIAGTGPYYYYVDGTDEMYQDLDLTGEVHLMLVNRSAASKSADDAGAILIELNFEPCLGW